jgi:hypothetical protein
MWLVEKSKYAMYVEVCEKEELEWWIISSEVGIKWLKEL